MEWHKFKKGEKVRLDAGFRNASTVRIVCQIGESRMFTRVKSYGYEWDVMTNRLTKILKENKQ
jgi:hypothetical protein